jgi:hypothetical protein
MLVTKALFDLCLFRTVRLLPLSSKVCFTDE